MRDDGIGEQECSAERDPHVDDHVAGGRESLPGVEEGPGQKSTALNDRQIADHHEHEIRVGQSRSTLDHPRPPRRDSNSRASPPESAADSVSAAAPPDVPMIENLRSAEETTHGQRRWRSWARFTGMGRTARDTLSAVRTPALTAQIWRRASAAVAGIVFAVLLLVAMTLMRLALSDADPESLRTVLRDVSRSGWACIWCPSRG